MSFPCRVWLQLLELILEMEWDTHQLYYFQIVKHCSSNHLWLLLKKCSIIIISFGITSPHMLDVDSLCVPFVDAKCLMKMFLTAIQCLPSWSKLRLTVEPITINSALLFGIQSYCLRVMKIGLRTRMGRGLSHSRVIF